MTLCNGPSVSGSSLPSICCLVLLSKSQKYSAHRLIFYSVFISKVPSICFHKVTLVVVLCCLISRFCQPIDSLCAFSSVQFVIQLLCCACSFNCYSSICVSLCLFTSSMIFVCLRLLPLLEQPLFPGYCLLDCCIPPPGLPFLQGLATSRDPAVLAVLLFHCFRKYCPFRLFTVFHVVDDIIGIVISYCV